MLLYEILIAIGIVVVLVVAAIDRLAARVMMGPEEMALLRLARAATAQRRLVASAAQQEREARAAAAQRRLVAYWTHALAAPLPARLAALITQLETQEVSAYGACASLSGSRRNAHANQELPAGVSGSAHQFCAKNNELSDLFDLCFLDNDLDFWTHGTSGTNSPKGIRSWKCFNTAILLRGTEIASASPAVVLNSTT
jgi:hypothetical protein